MAYAKNVMKGGPIDKIMDTNIQKQIEAYELARSKYLKKITKEDLRNSRLLCEPQILRSSDLIR